MSRKPRVQRTPEEKWEVVLEGLQSGNIAETCRRYQEEVEETTATSPYSKRPNQRKD